MSYDNVVGGKLKLKGKALDVRGGGVKKKKAKKNESFEQKLLENETEELERVEPEKDPPNEQDGEEGGGRIEGQRAVYVDHRTPAEKTYDEQRIRLEVKRLAKVESKSHRQKIEEFNQYLANLSEHYDIPKVGPG